MTAAQLGVGRHGQLPLLPGRGLPFRPVGHDCGEDGLTLPVGLLQGAIAAGPFLFPGGLPVIAAAPGGVRLGGGAQAGQAGVPGGVADLAEFVPDPLRRPGGLDGIGVAQVQQHPVRHPAHVRAVDRAEGGQGLVPGGAQVRGGCGGFGSDRVGGVVVAG